MLFNLSNIFPISLATEIQWTRWLYDRSSPARIFQRLELKQNRGNPGWGSMRREKKFIPPLCTIFDIDRAKTRRKDPRKNGRNDPPLFFQKLLSKWKTRSKKKGRKRGFNERSINRSSITIHRPLREDKQAFLLLRWKEGWGWIR